MPDERETLTRETFQLERDFHYWQFRQQHWDNAEVVATCPNPTEREEMLRGFWNQDAEKRYPEYRAAVSGLGLTELEAEREQWLDRLSLLSEREYKDILAETAAKTPANDNAKTAETAAVKVSYDRELFVELRADYAAAKREDAHWYGRSDGYDKMLEHFADAASNHNPPEKDKGKER